MAEKLRIKRLPDGELCVLLPQAMTRQLQIREGDDLLALPLPQGYLLLKRHNAKFERTMHLGSECMRKYATTLKKLSRQ